MTELLWGKVGDKRYETGTSHGVLYHPNNSGQYTLGYAWNGLVSVTQSPTGAESNKQYADNTVYVNLVSVEEFAGTIEAFTYPDEFELNNGNAIINGVSVGQQNRLPFGFSYQSLIGNDVEGTDYGYKIHLIYGAQAGVSELNHQTVNETPEAATMSWEITTTPVSAGAGLKPTARLTIDSTDHTPEKMQALKDILYGTAGTNPRLPLPAEVIALFAGSVLTATPARPAFNETTDKITIPNISGVIYEIGGVPVVPGDITISVRTIVTARPVVGYKFPTNIVTAWQYDV